MRIAREEGGDKLLLLKQEGGKLIVVDTERCRIEDENPFRKLSERHGLSPDDMINDWRLLAGSDRISSISWITPDNNDSPAFYEISMLVWVKMRWNNDLNIWVPETVHSSLEDAIEGLEGTADDWRRIATYEFSGLMNDKIGRDVVIMYSHFYTQVGRIA